MKNISWAIMGTLVLVNVARASEHLDDKRAWSSISSPTRMSSTFNRQYAELPLTGSVSEDQKTWSSDYWARNKGGINYRWNSSSPTGFNLKSPTKAEAMAMTSDQLAALAPSEKWDLFNGRYDYPLKNEVARYASPSRPSWEGICDGWAGAALNHDEPKPVTMTNPDGISIPFGAADVKGILSWYYAKKWSGGFGMMGYRCNDTFTTYDRCTNDMNAGAFHIVLTNRVGLSNVSFIADIDRHKEVWNHLAYKYNTRVIYSNLRPRSTSASGTTRVVRVRTTVYYVFLVRNLWEPVLGTSNQKLTTRTYEYYLDLNSSGRVIGGDWYSTQRPDFLWLEHRASFSGYYAKLPDLLPDGLILGETETNDGTDAEVANEIMGSSPNLHE
jgi:hypothetical protein